MKGVKEKNGGTIPAARPSTRPSARSARSGQGERVAPTIVLGPKAGLALLLVVIVAALTAAARWYSVEGRTLFNEARAARWDIPAPSAADMAPMEADVREAINSAQQAVSNDPQLAATWRRLGMTYDAHALWTPAEVAYQRSLALAPNDSQTAYYLAFVSFMLDRPVEVIQSRFQRVLELAPTYGPAWVRLGEVYVRAGRLTEARDAFQHAIESYPSPEAAARARRELGLALLSLGDAQGAVAQLEQVLSVRADDSVTYSGLAQAYNQLGDAPNARAATAKAKSLSETLGYFDDWRVAVLELSASTLLVERRISDKALMGQFDAAIDDAKRWAARHPNWPGIQRLIGNLYRQAGHPELAQPYFDRARQLVEQGQNP